MKITAVAIFICLLTLQLFYAGAADILEAGGSPETILAKLSQMESEVAKNSYTVSCLHTSRLTFEPHARPPTSDIVAHRTSAQTEWVIGSGDSRYYTCRGTASNVRSDGSATETTRTEKSIFNGLKGEGRTIQKTRSADGEIHVNDRTGTSFGGGGGCPLRLAGYVAGTRTSDLLEGTRVQVIDELHLDGYTVAVLQTEPKQIEGESASYYSEIWVDTQRWLTVKRKFFHREDASRPFKPTMQIKCEHFVLVSERLWLPSHIHLWSWDSDAEDNVRKGRESHFAYEGWKIVPELPENQFTLEFTVDDPTSDK